MAHAKQLLVGTTVAVDSTTLEANAAMKSIVRRDTGEDYQKYLERLMREEGLVEEGEEPTAEERRKFDKTRKKTASNDEWVNPNDPAAKIARMKDGTTHLAYKAEHVIDLDSGLLVAAEITPADQGDTQTLTTSVTKAEVNMAHAGHEQLIEEVVADAGYHSNELLTALKDELACRSYIPNQSSNTSELGRTSRPNKKPRCMPIEDGCAAHEDGVCNASVVNRSNEALLTSSRRAEPDESGCAESRTTPSGTRSPLPRKISVA